MAEVEFGGSNPRCSLIEAAFLGKQAGSAMAAPSIVYIRNNRVPGILVVRCDREGHDDHPMHMYRPGPLRSESQTHNHE